MPTPSELDALRQAYEAARVQLPDITPETMSWQDMAMVLAVIVDEADEYIGALVRENAALRRAHDVDEIPF